MTRSNLFLLGMAAQCAAILGCSGSDSTPAISPAAERRAMALSSFAQDSAPPEQSRDAAPPMRELFRIDVYHFTAPLGSLGRNEDFWKRIDEQCVDVATYDLLFKNGLRVGVAPMSEFSGIRKHIDADSTCTCIAVTGSVAKEIQLETRKDLVEQTIFHFDSDNNAVGRSYDRSTNLLNLSFEPTPRKPGSVRVKLCPMVRTSRTRLEFSELNDEREIKYVSPEMLYDLNMRVDIPPETFFILAPSSDATRNTSVGHAFLTQDGGTEHLEQVLVLVPRPLNVDDPLRAPRPSAGQTNP
jgi:hypothetical protein